MFLLLSSVACNKQQRPTVGFCGKAPSITPITEGIHTEGIPKGMAICLTTDAAADLYSQIQTLIDFAKVCAPANAGAAKSESQE